MESVNICFRNVSEFPYLDTYVTSDNGIDYEVSVRIQISNRCLFALLDILCSRVLSRQTKLRTYICKTRCDTSHGQLRGPVPRGGRGAYYAPPSLEKYLAFVFSLSSTLLTEFGAPAEKLLAPLSPPSGYGPSIKAEKREFYQYDMFGFSIRKSYV